MRPITILSRSASAATLPSGAVGVWYMDQYQASPRPYIPNAASSAPSISNLLSGSRGLFKSGNQFWSNNNCTVTDDAAAGPDGAIYAATMVASTTGWSIGRGLASLPAGTYTLALNVKRGGASDETFKLAGSGVLTATSAWQRFTYTFAHVGGAYNIFLLSNTTVASLIIDNFELYSGSSDLGPEVLAGHMYVGVDAYNQKGSYASGVLDLTTQGDLALAQFATAPSFASGVTVVGLFNKTAADSGYVALLAAPNNYNTFGAWIKRGNGPSFNYSNGSTYSETYPQFWDFLSKGWHTIAQRYDPVGLERSTWIDSGKSFREVATLSAQTIRHFLLSAIDGSSIYGGGHKFAGGVLLFNRALSDAEIRQAEAVLLARGTARNSLRVLTAEGDSITQGVNQYVSQFTTHQSPTSIGQIDAIGGATLVDVANRLPQTRLMKPATPVAGSKYIFTIMVTNSVGLLGTAQEYIDALIVICDTMRADGWIVAVGTVTPRNDSSFNAKRATVNAAIRTWVGTHCDAVFDFAADATIGPDAAAANATYYPDGTHPTAAVQSTYMEPIYRAVVNAL